MMREPGNTAGRMGMEVKPWTRWQNWVNVVLGIILFISPWVTGTAFHMGLPADTRAAWDAWIVGVLIALVALWALATPHSPIPEWINLVLGIWLFISPWVLGFAGLRGQAWTAWIIGILVVIMAVWALMEVMRPRSAPAA